MDRASVRDWLWMVALSIVLMAGTVACVGYFECAITN